MRYQNAHLQTMRLERSLMADAIAKSQPTDALRVTGHIQLEQMDRQIAAYEELLREQEER